MGQFSRASSPAGAPIVNLPCGTTTISGQPFEQSRNDVPGAGVCTRAGGKAVLKTSATERTPWAGFQSYLPDITRASPVNFSESVPASFAKAACIPAGCACANGTIRAAASADTAY